MVQLQLTRASADGAPPATECAQPDEGFSGSLGNTTELRNPQLNLLGILRLSRYHLQSISRSILRDNVRLQGCLRSMKQGLERDANPEIWWKPGKAHYRNLQTCGLVWVDPVCASKISERRRRRELQIGFSRWEERGGSVAHLILTVPHTRDQSLKEVLEGHSQARRLMRNRKPWKRMAKREGLEGSLTGHEVTFGGNGWHVHTHEGLFLPGGIYGDQGPELEILAAAFLSPLEREIMEMWGDACLSAGLGLINEHGVKLRDNRSLASYVSKWGLDSELTKSHIKQGREMNLTPFDLLRKIRDGEDQYRPIFREFAVGFHGRKQLHWSHGMAEALGLNVAEDAAIAGEVDEDSAFLASLTRQEWFAVYRAEQRGELLEVASACATIAEGRKAVLAFIAKLTERVCYDRV